MPCLARQAHVVIRLQLIDAFIHPTFLPASGVQSPISMIPGVIMIISENSRLVTGIALLGLLIAACSNNSNSGDEGTGGAGYVPGTSGTGGSGLLQSTGGAFGSNGGGSTSFAGNNASGGVQASTSGGSTGFDPNVYCNGIFMDKSCSQTQLAADVRTVNMLLVLDESSSMNTAPTQGADTKWTIMRQALVAALSPVQDDINFGLLLFPYLATGIPDGSTSAAERCAIPDDPNLAVNIPIAAGRTNFMRVLDKVGSQKPAGGTPTAQALRQAYAYYTTGDGRSLTGSKWVLLATDGGPNCNATLTCGADTCTQNLDGNCGTSTSPLVNCCQDNGIVCLDDQASSSAIAQLASAGINTFVVGIPGSEAYAKSLNAFAVAGKQPNPNGLNGEKYYAVSATSTLQDLTAAFSQITTQLLRTCDIQLSTTPLVSQDRINVAIDCRLQPAVPAGSSADAGVDGFYIDYGQDPAHLKLVGAPCENMMTNGAHHVDIIAGCQTIN